VRTLLMYVCDPQIAQINADFDGLVDWLTIPN